MSAVTDRILDAARVRFPGVVDGSLKLELFNVTVDISQDALRVAPSNNSTADPATWLTDAQYQTHYALILDGLFARLLSQPGKPYTNLELAGFYADRFKQGMVEAADIEPSAEAATSDRILNSARAHLPGARDEVLKRELFNVVDDVARRVLRTTAPVNTFASPSTWLTDSQYQAQYQLILDGLLHRMFVQPGKEYSNPDLAAFHLAQYQQRFIENRDLAGVTPSPTVALTDRLINSLRTSLTGVRDPVIIEELWNTIDDMCRDGFLWRETMSITLVPGQDIYTNFWPAGSEIVHAFSVKHATLDTTNVVYEFGKLVIASAVPTVGDATTPLFLTGALAPVLDPGSDVEQWIPADMWSEHYQLILAGVKGRMMMQPSKPYTNPQMGMVNLRDYKSRKAVARQKVRTDGQIGAQLWRYPSFSRAMGA